MSNFCTMAFTSGRVNQFSPKFPDEILDYTLDISSYIDAETDFVLNVTCAIAPSGVNELQPSDLYVTTRYPSTYLTVTLSGGQPGRTYTLKYLAEMTDGRVFEFIVLINVNKILLSGVSASAPTSSGFSDVITAAGGGGNPVFSFSGQVQSPFWFVISPSLGMYIDGALSYDGPSIEYVGAPFQNLLTELNIDNAVSYVGRLFPQPALYPVGWNLTANALLKFTANSMKVWMGGFSPIFPALTTFSMPVLQHMNGVFSPVFNVLGDMSFPSLISMSNTFNPSVPLLTTFSMGDGLLAFNGDFILSGSLIQSSVDGILRSLANLDGLNGTTEFHNRLVDLSGGVNAAPSATGLAYKNILIARGNTVITL